MISIEIIFPYILVSMKCLLIFVSVIFFLSGIDDLFIDLCYFLRSVYRRVFILPKYPPLGEDRLISYPEKPIAVMIPAWDESAVIRPMLKNAMRNIRYSDYTIFVGAYPNDEATIKEVHLIQADSDRIELVVLPHDGPTNKSDCLNWIYQGIRRHEKECDVKFSAFVMQDCEDVIHPLCYKLFNYLIPRKDMVQLPVYSLPVKWYQLTAGHYIDEFAQGHQKDMVAREMTTRSLPSAGVGTAFSRKTFEVLGEARDNQIFSLNSLTEDYDFGFLLKQHNLKQAFVKFPIKRTVLRKGLFGGQREKTILDYICVKEYFPSGFHASVRQKSRWVLGIALQGWQNIGWTKNAMTNYWLVRDRKCLLTNLTNLLGYLVVVTVLLQRAMIWHDPMSYHYPPLVVSGTWLWNLILINAVFFAVRILQRMFFVYRLYGIGQALLSVPRMIWGNVINCFATGRAVRQFVVHLVTGKALSWDKTSHKYPSEDELMAGKRKIGDLLLEEKLITIDRLKEALLLQSTNQKPLGYILSKKMGLIDEVTLKRILHLQGAS